MRQRCLSRATMISPAWAQRSLTGWSDNVCTTPRHGGGAGCRLSGSKDHPRRRRGGSPVSASRAPPPTHPRSTRAAPRTSPHRRLPSINAHRASAGAGRQSSARSPAKINVVPHRPPFPRRRLEGEALRTPSARSTGEQADQAGKKKPRQAPNGVRFRSRIGHGRRFRGLSAATRVSDQSGCWC